MSKRVLADFHHGDLYESLRILFEDRFGWELYRPVGMEWYEKDLWMVFNHPETARQYLDVHLTSPPKTVDGKPVVEEHGPSAWLNKYSEDKGNGYYLVYDQNHGGRIHRGITHEAAIRDGFDYVISSMPEHFERYKRLAEQTGAKHIHQMGNIGWKVPNNARFILNSTATPVPPHIPCVYYHQEFSLEEFKFCKPENIRCLTNLMHYQQYHYYGDFKELRKLLETRGWEIRDYGAGNQDGPCLDISQALRHTGFVWHCKKGGDGYGHNIFNSFATGRPMVIRSRDYNSTTAGRLFLHDSTVFDLDKISIEESVSRLESAAENYDQWSTRVHRKFLEQVDFEGEANQIKAFFENVVDQQD